VKIIGTFSGVVIASIAMLQPAEAGRRGGGRSFSSGYHGSGGARHFAAPTRTFPGGGARFHSGGARFRSGGARLHNSSARFSSGTTFRNRSFSNSGPRFSGNRINRFDSPGVNPRGGFRNRTRSGGGTRFSGNRSSGFRNRGFNNNGRHIVGHRGRNWNRHWDKRRDHFWRGHRCRWINNSWVIFATGFYPYGYGYYPYGAYYPYGGYSYYDDGYYADSYASNEYAQSSGYDEGAADSSVSEVQSALSREGYYSGAVDGSLGPETRNALRRYQRARGLTVTGRIDRATMNALGLR
jgi:hypothetical protein